MFIWTIGDIVGVIALIVCVVLGLYIYIKEKK